MYDNETVKLGSAEVGLRAVLEGKPPEQPTDWFRLTPPTDSHGAAASRRGLVKVIVTDPEEDDGASAIVAAPISRTNKKLGAVKGGQLQTGGGDLTPTLLSPVASPSGGGAPNKLVVEVVGATRLPTSRFLGMSRPPCPYVVLEAHRKRHVTHVKPAGSDPVWGQAFEFSPVPSSEDVGLRVTVYSQNPGSLTELTCVTTRSNHAQLLDLPHRD